MYTKEGAAKIFIAYLDVLGDISFLVENIVGGNFQNVIFVFYCIFITKFLTKFGPKRAIWLFLEPVGNTDYTINNLNGGGELQLMFF